MGLQKICMVVFFSIAFADAVSRDRNNKKYKVVCYLDSTAYYRDGEGQFVIEDIDPFLCTHLIYSFANISTDHIAASDPYLDLKENNGLGGYERFNQLKTKNPSLTTLIAIGGRREESLKYSLMADDPSARATFVKSVVDFLHKYDFDGLDMDWTTPTNRGGRPQDKQNFVILLEELKDALEPHGLLLTAGVNPKRNIIDRAYVVPEMVKYLDFINVWAFDFHGPWENVTGQNSQLYFKEGDKGNNVYKNVDFAIDYWIQQGAPRSKLTLGMATFGRSFILGDTSKTGLGAPSIGRGKPGPFTKLIGVLGYNEICSFIKKGWQEVTGQQWQNPYAFQGSQWVGYDDKRSIGLKVDYLIKQNLGGGMIWSIDTDDFHGNCFGEKYPLLTTIANKLNSQDERLPTIPVPTTHQNPTI